MLIIGLSAITLYFSGMVNYANNNNQNNTETRKNSIPAKIRKEIEQKSKRFVKTYKDGNADSIRSTLETKKLISEDMRTNLVRKLDELKDSNLKDSVEEKQPYSLTVEPVKVSILDFKERTVKVDVFVKITKTYGYLDENWITVVWRNPDGTIGDPPKEIFTQDIILEFVKFYDWRVDKVQFVKDSKEVIYKHNIE